MDSESPEVVDFSRSVVKGESGDTGKAVKLYYAVRDNIRYYPYHIDMSPAGMKASSVLAKKKGYCVHKAIVLAAAARSQGIPSRLGFADVKNHLASKRLKELIRNDIYLYHGYTELFLDGKWVKTTPAFNLSLCEVFGVDPLEFDCKNDSMLQAKNSSGSDYMQYIRFHGEYAELPYVKIKEVMSTFYPFLLTRHSASVSGSFEQEVKKDQKCD